LQSLSGKTARFLKGGDLALGCGDCSQEPEGNEDEGAQKVALGSTIGKTLVSSWEFMVV
jgi:hypothetical protein